MNTVTDFLTKDSTVYLVNMTAILIIMLVPLIGIVDLLIKDFKRSKR